LARKVLILGEIRNVSLRNVSFEAIGAARIAAAEGEIIGVLIGDHVQLFGNELIQFGADCIVTVADDKLKQYTSDVFFRSIACSN
jgi:electron transfer flavoprotein alpha subunit